jgi:hypothetical protein
MAPSARWALVLSLPVLAAGFAVARGKKRAEEEAAAAPPPVVVEEVAPPAPAAPPLFPAALPVAVTTPPPGLASLSAQTCNACHWAAHDSWSGSAHASAWSSATYQAALTTAGESTACLGCHLPIAAQHDRLAAGYLDGDVTRPRLEANPAFDASLMSEGVTCVACHVREGTVLGTHASSASPHPVTVSAELGDSRLCATCHQLSWPEGDRPFYDTYGEWSASAYARAGVDCQDCHMAPTGGASQPGRAAIGPSHGSPTTVARALTTLITLPSADLVRGQPVVVGVRLLNTGAGHSVPSGNPFKRWTIETVLLDAAGKNLATPHQEVLARTVENAPPWRTLADERLAAGATKEWTATFTPNVKGAPGGGAVVVRAVREGQTVELRRVPVRVR